MHRVMGATGSGKSSFINLISGSELAVGRGLRSCTSKVETGNTFQFLDKMVTLVDTPGFDDTTVSDTDILKMISVYLSSTYQAGQKLSGLIYMHRISDFRMGGVSRRNLSMFRKLCGDETLRNVVIATTMWSEVTPERGAARELELRTDEILFKPLIDRGATMFRHENTLASAHALLRHLADNRPAPLRIQRELVDEGKDITQTAAGVELDRELAVLRQKHLKELAEIQSEMEAALLAKDLETREELEQVRQDLLKNMEKIESDRERLSREYEAERARADAEVLKIQNALEVERLAREEKEKQITKMMNDMEADRTANAQERALMRQQLEEARRASRRRGGGLFSAIGSGIDSVFGW
ncbi:hypothetical protein PHLGIDRAFT_109800 [Phlebiopsis gigantea 11061_1 CR5-6]|uniref:G domain-containing protein n=1 Tax=Phlebiopsis gigantea (strain 11061_1 CR5-6) TaxID=745531 RepID=A0A0C3S6T5_PHLG1|nr:hypothetical protein PHLGIDRAFT_109800 [Phlebiopsis gigantea 11061_1 CR5-6]